MVILITGIAGFVGSALARHILARHPDATVLGVDDLSTGFQAAVPAAVVFVPAHLGSRSPGVSALFAQYRPDIVVHAAAFAAEGLSPFVRCFNYQNNLIATAEITNLCIQHEVRRLVFLSSMAVYGKGTPPFDEEATPRPVDPYGVAKYASELDIEIAGIQHGLEWTVLRLHNVYGPGQSLWQPYRNVLGIWMASVLKGKPLLIYGDGSQERAFSFIQDCTPCILRAAIADETAGEIINLGGAQPLRIREAAEIFCQITGYSQVECLERRHEVHAAWCTTAKSEQLLGYREAFGFREGLSQMWAWARDIWRSHPDRRRLAVPGAMTMEVSQGLYSYWRPSEVTSVFNGARGD